MFIILETQRLLLRNFTIEDAPLIFQLNMDPEVTRYTHDPIHDLNHAAEILERVILSQYALFNHGRWAVLQKHSNIFMGWCGLKYRPERNEIDLGYRFKKEFWGRGYATEAAAASIRYGFEKLNMNRIAGRAEPENVASCKVLEKCGMSYIGKEDVDSFPVRVYEIWNDSSRA